MKKKTVNDRGRRRQSHRTQSIDDNISRNRTATAKMYSISTRRIWLFRLIALLVLPVLVCSMLEVVLRVVGVGYPTSIAVPCRIDGRDCYCNNIRFGWRFFPKEMSRQTEPFVFPREKEKNGYRIFILGESAAQGAPDGAYSFGRMLEVMLRKTYPGVRFEVITVAMPAINSHAVYPIARDCLGYDPDLFVVYMGNNEVVGPYGAGTIFSPLAGHLGLIRAGVFAKSTRLGQLMAEWAERVKNKTQTPNWRGMEMFLDRRVGRDDKALARVYRHFQANLEDILRGACGRQVPVVLCTVGSNLRDCPPFASQHGRTLSEEDKKEFGTSFALGKQAEDDRDFERALRGYRAALSIDNGFAEVHFRMGQCYWQEARYEEAKDCYIQALDRDTLRFRADPQINKIIGDAARKYQGRGVYFVDVTEVFSENSPHGVAGRELFYEHVHMTPNGNYLLAQAVFSEMRRILPASVQGENANPGKLVSQAECERSLAYTKWEEYRIHETVLNGFIKRPPFTNQAYQSERLAYFNDQIGSLQRELTADAKREIAAQYRQAIAENPSDWWLYWKYAEFLSEMDPDPSAALQYYRQVERMIPHYAQVHERLGVCHGKLGQLDQAIESCEKSVVLDPFRSYARFHLGYAYQLKGDTDKAGEQYRIAVRLEPENGPAWNDLGGILYSKGDVAEAIATYRKALEHVHDFSDLNYNLAVLLHQQGNRPEAIQELEAGLKIDPNSVKIRQFLHGLRQQ
jgi:tetratricopeptide (TPR) repeat protein